MLVTQFVTQTVNNHFNLHINLHFVFNNVDVYAIISTCLQGGYSMKKRIIIAIGLTVALSMTSCASKEITQTKTETTVELGSECTIIPTDYFELGSKVNPETIAVDTSSVDTNTVGEYVAVVTYNDNTYEIKVSVSDTIVPEIVVKPDIEGVDRGTTIHPADYVEVNDLSEVEVYFVAEDGDVSSLEIPSDLDDSVTEINYTVVAVDAESNRSEELSVAIPIFTFKQGEIEGEALPLEEEPTQPDNTSGVDSTSNNVTLGEDDYVEPLETTPDDSASTTVNKNATEKEQLENKSNKTLEETLRLAELKYEAGEIPEEDYKQFKEDLEYLINKQNNQSQSEPEVIMPEGALELDEPTEDNRDIDFSAPSNPDLANIQVQ